MSLSFLCILPLYFFLIIHYSISHTERDFKSYLLIIINIFAILQINGINVESILAGAGIIGIIFGFAVQDALKDIIRGMTILTDKYFQKEFGKNKDQVF